MQQPREGDRAADGYARAQGGELVPPGLAGRGMRCTGAWAARGTRKGVQEGSAVPRSGQRVAVLGAAAPGFQHPTREPDAKQAQRDESSVNLPQWSPIFAFDQEIIGSNPGGDGLVRVS